MIRNSTLQRRTPIDTDYARNATVGEFLSMGEVYVQLGNDGDIGDPVSFDPATGIISAGETGTQVRNIDEIAGITTVGRWEDELISVRVAEPAAKAELYGDSTNIPLADYRQSIESRGVVRFEQGFQVGKLEEARQSAIGYQAADEKRRAATESLDISRNQVGFYGFNQPDTNVYGLLNDPSLPAYLTTGTPWLTATFDQLVTEFNRLPVLPGELF